MLPKAPLRKNRALLRRRSWLTSSGQLLGGGSGDGSSTVGTNTLKRTQLPLVESCDERKHVSMEMFDTYELRGPENSIDLKAGPALNLASACLGAAKCHLTQHSATCMEASRCI